MSPILSFGVVADLQFADIPPENNRYFRNSPEKLAAAIRVFNDRELSFVVNLGDTIDRDWQNFDEILPHFQTIKAPVRHLLGNHDYEIENDFKHLVPDALGIEPYYDFKVRDWRFLVLDGNQVSVFANLPGSEKYNEAINLISRMETEGLANAQHWNGAIGSDQLQWLLEKLDFADRHNEKVIIFCHYPVFPADRHNLLNDLEVLEILDAHRSVKAWLCGHHHRGNYGMKSGIHHINVKGMVDHEYETAWSVVNLYEDLLLMEGFGNEISTRLAIQ